MPTEYHWADGQLDFYCACFDLLLAGLGIFKNDTDNKVSVHWLGPMLWVSNPSDPLDFAPGLKSLEL